MSKPPKIRNVLITGGTGSVGRALVRAFSRNGDSVSFQFHSASRKAREIGRLYNASAIQLNFEASTVIKHPKFDIVINNAGINITDPITHRVSMEDWTRTIHMNMTVPFAIAKQCLPHMKKQQWGRIINISSIYGLRAVEGRCPYTASKHGLSGITKTIAKEYAQWGITCNEICPGPINSEMMKRIAKENQEKTGQPTKSYFDDVISEIPAGRLADPNEIAQLALFVASSNAAYLTGASIPLDGGMIA